MDRSEINKKADEAMESLNGVSRATPAPYLMTRIKARLANEEAPNFWSRAGAFLSRPVVAGVGLAVFLMVNFVAVTSIDNNNNSTTVSTQGPNNSRYEFAINVLSIYDIENQEP